MQKYHSPLDFFAQNSYYLSRGYYSLSFVFVLRAGIEPVRSQNKFSVTKEEFKIKLSHGKHSVLWLYGQTVDVAQYTRYCFG